MRWLGIGLMMAVAVPLGCTRDNPGFSDEDDEGKDTDPSGSGPNSASSDSDNGASTTGTDTSPTPTSTSTSTSTSTTGPDHGSSGGGSTGEPGCVPDQSNFLLPGLQWPPGTDELANCADSTPVVFTGIFVEGIQSDITFGTCGCDCVTPPPDSQATVHLGTTPPEFLFQQPNRCFTVEVYPGLDPGGQCVHQGYVVRDATNPRPLLVGFDGIPPEGVWPSMQIVEFFDHRCGERTFGCDDPNEEGVYGVEFNDSPFIPADPAAPVLAPQTDTEYMLDLRKALANISGKCGLYISFTAEVIP